MAIIKEFCCVEHGDFEASHPICPQDGCDSSEVIRVFRTPPNISKGRYKRFDAGLRKSSEMMGISDFKTSKEGDVAFKGRGTEAPKGMEVLWGNQVEKSMGTSFAALTGVANKPLNVGKNDRYSNMNNGIAGAFTESGRLQQLARRGTPFAGEVTGADKSERPAAQALVT